MFAFKKNIQRCQSVFEDVEGYMIGTATKIIRKLDTYEGIVCTRTGNLARILDPRLRNYIINDRNLLREFVSLPYALSAEEIIALPPQTLLVRILQDHSQSMPVNCEEVNSFRQCTVAGHQSVDPLVW